MTIRRLLGLFLLLWMVTKRANGEETISSFIRDIMTTFKLNSPTIIYDSDEAPDICFTDQWVLCLSSQDKGIRAKEPIELTNKSTSGVESIANGMSGFLKEI